MRSDGFSYAKMIKFLESESLAGKKWAAFKGYELPQDRFSILCFMSSLEASDFCNENPYQMSESGEWEEDSCYYFYAIENLIKEFQLAQGIFPSMMVVPPKIEELALEQGIFAFSEYAHPLSATELAYGCIVPVMKPFTITPITLMEQFHIVRHAHESVGMIYELGHSHGILQSYSEFSTAERELVDFAHKLPKETSRTSYDLILVGQFKDHTLRLNYEGYPEYNTGLPLKTAFYDDGALKVNMITDPFKEMTINQRFFARYSSDKGGLVFFDDGLHEIVPGASFQSFVESYFRSNLGMLLLSAPAPDLKVVDLFAQQSKQLQVTTPAGSSKRILTIKGSFPVGSRNRKSRRRR